MRVEHSGFHYVPLKLIGLEWFMVAACWKWFTVERESGEK